MVFLNNAVWDIEHGTVIKLGEDRSVAAAVSGYDVLHKQQIHAIYGDPPFY